MTNDEITYELYTPAPLEGATNAALRPEVEPYIDYNEPEEQGHYGLVPDDYDYELEASQIAEHERQPPLWFHDDGLWDACEYPADTHDSVPDEVFYGSEEHSGHDSQTEHSPGSDDFPAGHPALELPGPGLSDLDNARRLVCLFPWTFRHVRESKADLWFDGKRWVRNSAEIARLVRKLADGLAGTLRSMGIEPTLPPTGLTEDQKYWRQQVLRLRSDRGLKSTLNVARAEQGIDISQEVLDADRWLINVQNGTYDLRRQRLEGHNAANYLTKLSGFVYDPQASCPRFRAFLQQVLPDEAVRSYLQQLIGSMLTGVRDEQAFYIMSGPPASGKSTVLNILSELLGDYAQAGGSELLMPDKKGSGPRPELARLQGARLVFVDETHRGQKVAEELLKRLVSGTPIAARTLYEDIKEFKPQCHLVIATNFLPCMDREDEALKRRLRIIPFETQIAYSQQNVNLVSELLEETAGILNWALEGFSMWMSNDRRIPPPTPVTHAVEQYYATRDALGTFITQQVSIDGPDWVPAQDIERMYNTWAVANGAPQRTSTSLGIELGDRGYARRRGRSGNSWMLR